jgi:hypothetical protein
MRRHGNQNVEFQDTPKNTPNFCRDHQEWAQLQGALMSNRGGTSPAATDYDATKRAAAGS